jgi:hypothetical protein
MRLPWAYSWLDTMARCSQTSDENLAEAAERLG